MLTEMFSRLRAMRPGTRLAALLCAAAVACCLALPPVVFAVWDGMLFAGTHPRADAGQAEPLGDAARANPAACLLYNCAHLLGVDPARPSGAPDQWQARTPAGQDLADAKARCAAAVDSAAALGLLADADAARLRAALDGSGYLLTAQDGPAGLTAYSLAPGPVPEEQPADAGPADALTLTLALTLTADGRPVYFSWQDSGRAGAAGRGRIYRLAAGGLGRPPARRRRDRLLPRRAAVCQRQHRRRADRRRGQHDAGTVCRAAGLTAVYRSFAFAVTF